MKTGFHTSIVLLLTVLIAGCSSLGTDDELDLDNSFFERALEMTMSTVSNSLVSIEQSQTGSYKFSEKTNEVINDPGSFATLWDDLHANRIPLPELPEVDFTEYTVIASMMGIQNSGGHSIEILKVANADNVIGVKIEEREPGAGCVTTAVLTSPFHIVKIPKTSGSDIRFTTDRITFECNSR
ncbi:MAG: protease complex subunit PrcB family protein [Balneolaceae bacterium]